MSFRKGCKIIFDMDGVITSEERYWDAAALTVWELLHGPHYLGIPPGSYGPGLIEFKTAVDMEEIALIRRVVFQEGKVIAYFKQRAINSNWDLAFLTFSFQLVLLFRFLHERGLAGKEIPVKGALKREDLPLILFKRRAVNGNELKWFPSFGAVLNPWCGKAMGLEIMGKLTSLLPLPFLELGKESFYPASPLWEGVKCVFQEWYFGEREYKELYGESPFYPGKDGLIYREEPILPAEKIRNTLQELRRQGWSLGIATGRPSNELYIPLEKMDLWGFFDPESVVTYDDVAEAEKKHRLQGILPLGKPHPFSFLKAYWGKGCDEKELFNPPYPRVPGDCCFVVGDSPADLLAAREMGAAFIGVLTGYGKDDVQSLFLKEGARAVLPDITRLPGFLAGQGLLPRR